jgi:hypothetical protein
VLNVDLLLPTADGLGLGVVKRGLNFFSQTVEVHG